MTDLIIQAILLATFIVVVINSKPYQWWMDWTGLPTEPFRCAMCLGWWCGVAFFVWAKADAWPAIWAASVTSFAGELLDRKLNE
jgi:hypothetical protein